jgi:E3 ubiquitin-protein ligase SIAH1
LEKYFCLHFEAFQLGKAPVYIALIRFMGDDDESKKFNYNLEHWSEIDLEGGSNL